MIDPSLIKKFKIEDNEFKIEDFLKTKLLDVKQEILFFSKMDKSRQQGLYADYKDGLISVSELEYKQLHKKISGLNIFLNSLIESLKVENLNNDKHSIDHIAKTKKDFNANIRGKLRLLLAKINTPQFNSYEHLLTMLEVVFQDVYGVSSDGIKHTESEDTISRIIDKWQKTNRK